MGPNLIWCPSRVMHGPGSFLDLCARELFWAIDRFLWIYACTVGGFRLCLILCYMWDYAIELLCCIIKWQNQQYRICRTTRWFAGARHPRCLTGGGDNTHGLQFPLVAKRLACMVASSATAEHVLDILTHMNLSQGINPDEMRLSPPPSLLPKR